MPSLNTLFTALVAGFAIGSQASPCRPHAPYSSAVQSQVTTTEHTQSALETSISYPDAVSKSETDLAETILFTTGLQVTSSSEAEPKPTATDDATTEGYTAAESVSSATSASLTTQSAPEAQETTSSLPLTTSAESKTTLGTTTLISSTTSPEPETTLDTTALDPTTTTSQASTTTSEASTPSCPPASELTCGETGFFGGFDSANHLLDTVPDKDLEQCQAECENNPDCTAIGIYTSNQCELYDASVSVLEFDPRADWWFSVYDACCFKE